MAFSLRGSDYRRRSETVQQDSSSSEPTSLPALVRKRDLALLVVLVTIIASDTQGMQFAENAVFFYWFLAFVTFLLPSLGVFSWLTRQAPPHVPLYVWMVRLVSERWRFILLFLTWWPGVLIVLATLGTCVSLLQRNFPPWLDALPMRFLVFILLLSLATLLIALPLRHFRRVLWIGGLLYLGAFLLVILTALIVLATRRSAAISLLHPALIGIPAHFSWSLFGLALVCLFGLNGPLLLDGEMRGTQHFLRGPGSTRFLWWGGFGSFLLLLSVSGAWIGLNPTLHTLQTPLLNFLIPVMIPVLGAWVVDVFRVLLFLGIFGCALAYLFIFSRTFLLATRMGYLPRSLGKLNPAGTPSRAILLQSLLVACAAMLIFLIVPALLRDFLPQTLVDELNTGDQFGLFTSIAGSLWCALTILMFVFALWLCWTKHRHAPTSRRQRLLLSTLCLFGCLTSLVCVFAPLLPGWPLLFFSRTHWFPLVLLGVVISLALAWMTSELPRRSALVREREKSLAREKALRTELQQAYARERELNQRLRESYAEVNQLYHEQELAAMTDPVTGLLNRRTLRGRVEEKIAQSQNGATSFLLLFLDVDHFKAINDTWGHLAGDAVLQDVAARLKQSLRPGDIAGRYGGEEFLMVKMNATIDQALEEGERLRQAMQATPCQWWHMGEIKASIDITVSIGVAAYGLHGTGSKELLEAADKAMYQAKMAGRNCVRVAGNANASALNY